MTGPKIAKRTRTAAKAPAAKRTTTRTAATPASAATPRSKAAPAPAVVDARPKQKLVRDSFTIPKVEYAVLEGLKARAANLKRPTKKSELLRAGVAALHAMTDKAFLSVLSGVPSLKTGRPKAAHADVKPARASVSRE